MTVDVQFALQQPAPLKTAQIVEWATCVIEQMSSEEGPVSTCVRIVEAAESHRLNAQYRGIDKPTNVLSFAAGTRDPDTGEWFLGDVVICDPVVRQEAQEQGKSLRDHYAHMVVHGMLHLFGYDHVDPREAGEMEDAEREILGRIGVADPYGDG
jgi:probable rRNA maturation factor